MTRHLLVTNDFPPKHGGIQSYLWELWRRLDPEEVVVLTTPHQGDRDFDAAQPYRVVRDPARVLLPTPSLTSRIDALADEVGADLVLLDPVLPLGFVGPRLRHRYGIVLHGAEVTVAAQARLGRLAMAEVLRGAELVIAAGSFPAAEAERVARRPLPVVNVPPGVDPGRFVPLDDAARRRARTRFGLSDDARRGGKPQPARAPKGDGRADRVGGPARAELSNLEVVIGGTGRDLNRLERLVRATAAPVRFVGKVADEDLPSFYACADIFAMLCRNRWAGLEQEGFGIVFLEAAACGVPQVAGRSGGSPDAVEDEVSGLVVADPRSVGDATTSLRRLLLDDPLRRALGAQGRRRAE